MSASSASTYQHTQKLNYSVSLRLLLSLYLIIPLCVGVQYLDMTLWQGVLKAQLPSSPSHFLLFQLLFGTPHIIASALIFISNREYRQLYQPRVMGMTALLALVFAVGSLWLPYQCLYIGVAAWTVLHVLKQQHGVARGVCRLSVWLYHTMLGLSVAAGVLIYIGIFLKNSLTVSQVDWIITGTQVLCVLLIIAGLWAQQHCRTLHATLFMWANIALIISSYYLYHQQYYFLAILAPRLVHDLTAYIFYGVHDYNKHHQQPQNLMYRIGKICRIPLLLILPVLSLSLAFILQRYGDAFISELTALLFGVALHKVVTLGLLGYLGLMHYYTESFTWQQQSPYRQFIRFSR